ncbi:MAG: hypothetical protein K0S65_294 [Labilithrix sp.]|nr:hypothetical protein [Labilithrix sp.]
MKELATPFPAHWTVRQARDAYLAENGFTVESYEDAWTDASFFGVPFKVPNTKRHQWAIRMHDLHHIAAGYGTDLIGEGEISAWELRGRATSLGFYVGGIVLLGTLAGAVFAPRRVLTAWRDARSLRSLHDLFPTTDTALYEKLLGITVGELRARLGLPSGGIARQPRKLHHFAPASI